MKKKCASLFIIKFSVEIEEIEFLLGAMFDYTVSWLRWGATGLCMYYFWEYKLVQLWEREFDDCQLKF